MAMRLLLVLTVLALPVFAGGDKPGEEQPPPPSHLKIPPAPLLSADQALTAFKVQPGFRIELVAAEPLIQRPVCMAFDADGRIWATEFTNYMLDTDGTDELAPTGNVVMLEDTNGDGKMDKRHVFADKLVLPRAIMPVNGGVLVGEPPNLWFMRDTDGDNKADEKISLSDDFGKRDNPEHYANGPLINLDNWIYFSNYSKRFKYINGKWESAPAIARGQFGHSHDDWGRLYHNNNSNILRGDMAPMYYYQRTNHFTPLGINLEVMKEQTVWPGRMNTGINRGYNFKIMLRPDGTLINVTGACAPWIYRGAQFGPEFQGNAFVCEPCAHLVKRIILKDENAMVTASNAYKEAEFLTSTDERCRPVWLADGPDGALYMVDMYIGILQHRNFLTTFLKKQILERGLDKPATGTGRIYRIVKDGAPKYAAPPALSKATAAELVAYLSHANGWFRDTAKRLLLERNDTSVVAAVKDVALKGATPTARVYALWTLEGLGQLDLPTILAALADAHPRVRCAAIRLSEPHLQDAAALDKVLSQAADNDPDVQLQLMLTLSGLKDAKAENALDTVLRRSAGIQIIRDAALTGLKNRELEFLERLLGDAEWAKKQPGRDVLIGNLAGCVFVEGNVKRIDKLLGDILALPADRAWQKVALLDGMINTRPKTKVAIRYFNLPAEPSALVELRKSEDTAVSGKAKKLDDFLAWPGKKLKEPDVPAVPLTPEQQDSYARGQPIFHTLCATCHQMNGQGEEGKAPPLLDSDWLLGSDERLVRLVIHGMRGPLNVKGKIWNLEMPAAGEALKDQQIADVLTFLRREWGHKGNPIHVDFVKRVREASKDRDEPWTEKELLKVKDPNEKK